jgi:hypothetical protein
MPDVRRKIHYGRSGTDSPDAGKVVAVSLLGTARDHEQRVRTQFLEATLDMGHPRLGDKQDHGGAMSPADQAEQTGGKRIHHDPLRQDQRSMLVFGSVRSSRLDVETGPIVVF